MFISGQVSALSPPVTALDLTADAALCGNASTLSLGASKPLQCTSRLYRDNMFPVAYIRDVSLLAYVPSKN